MPTIEDLRLFRLIAITVAIYAGSWRLAGRWNGASRSARLADTVALSLLARYVILSLCGWTGLLTLPVVTILSILVSIAMYLLGKPATAAAGTAPNALDAAGKERLRQSQLILGAAAFFVVGYIASIVWHQRYLAVPSTDALAYHLPTCVQWMQDQAFSLFECWYWNPANTYSPLGGSVWMTWWMLPLQNDAFVRFVQIEPLALIFVLVIAILRKLGATPVVAGATAIATVLARPYLSQIVYVKDDLFVAAFFVATAFAAVPDRLGSMVGAARFGICLGLMVSTKLPAILVLPALLPLIDAPFRAGWKVRHWIVAFGVAIALPAPWLIRNLYLTGNPLYPTPILGLPGLMTIAQEEGIRSPARIWTMWTEEFASIPRFLLVPLLLMLLVAIARAGKRLKTDPLLRWIVFSTLIGVIAFSFISPLRDLRYEFGLIAPLFIASGWVIMRLTDVQAQWLVSGLLVIGAIATQFNSSLQTKIATFVLCGLLTEAIGLAIFIFWERVRLRTLRIAIAFGALIPVYLWIHDGWSSYIESLPDAEIATWEGIYGDLGKTFAFVRDEIPPAETIAYANTYYVYPLQGFSFDRRVVYAPVRKDIDSFLQLPFIGHQVTPLQTNYRMADVMNASPDAGAWLEHLRERNATYLLIMIADYHITPAPPEMEFVKQFPDRFTLVNETRDARVYRIAW